MVFPILMSDPMEVSFNSMSLEWAISLSHTSKHLQCFTCCNRWWQGVKVNDP